MIGSLGALKVLPVMSNLALVAEPTVFLLQALSNIDQNVGVAKIDPAFSDTAAFCEHYKIDLGQTVNCVVIKAIRGDKSWFATCLVFGNTRADVNGSARRHLNARKASFAPMEEAITLTKMEYGGITPIGLPSDWPILIDKAIADSSEIIIGSGIRRSKMIVTGKFLASLPNVTVIEGLGVTKI